ncbi:NUDIX domain-containing protein [candidate division TA06 bacterium]|uniref:NUDIX domain-containing protein n=1 Tax=candidate division TA06 bacterium TaxID=2250710 RepID=A0A933I9L0_UNCT6|nr:NUDIX domain-containing protein [candidate division TA06 bacterium]
MSKDRLTEYVRAKVVCVFRNQDRILVCDGYDPTKKELFYCPPGGKIEFGEPSEAAIRREIKEELGSEIKNLALLGVLENRFIFDGQQGHEIVFVYDAELTDKSLYAADRFKAQESNGQVFNALWLDLGTIGPDTPPVYPDGLIALMKISEQNIKR